MTGSYIVFLQLAKTQDEGGFHCSGWFASHHGPEGLVHPSGVCSHRCLHCSPGTAFRDKVREDTHRNCPVIVVLKISLHFQHRKDFPSLGPTLKPCGSHANPLQESQGGLLSDATQHLEHSQSPAMNPESSGTVVFNLPSAGTL